MGHLSQHLVSNHIVSNTSEKHGHPKTENWAETLPSGDRTGFSLKKQFGFLFFYLTVQNIFFSGLYKQTTLFKIQSDHHLRPFAFSLVKCVSAEKHLNVRLIAEDNIQNQQDRSLHLNASLNQVLNQILQCLIKDLHLHAQLSLNLQHTV